MEYKPTIGLEIHAELKTVTKLFCNSKNDSDEKKPNVNICPICMGHPGTLPVINKEAIKHVLKVGLVLGGELADFTEFDRKNYFYPDIPKGYQISQYKYPLISGGSLNNVAITRVHLEEDTARSTHEKDKSYSLIDFNRAGVPLMELVTEPVVGSAEEAGAFARELQLLLRYLGASDANMEKGEMRVEANISVSQDEKMGIKVEVKNLNSFRSVERAITFEIKRQSKLLDRGETVIQETRGWDEGKQQTFSQRVKEGSEEYRYFPEPDLPKLKISEIPEFRIDELKKELPELPWEKRKRYKNYGIKDEDVEMYIKNTPVFVEGGRIRMAGVGTFFEKCLKFCQDDRELIALVSNYITSDLPGVAKKLIDEATTPGHTGIIAEGFPDANNFVELVQMFKNKEISSRATKDILIEMMRFGESPREIAKRRGLFQKSDAGELEAVVEKIIKEHANVASDYRGGKESALQFLIGQGMKETKGSANPEILKKLLISKLSVK